ncbi:hypothetical protein BDV96DRAFT_649643 [Lophiotrema nucula]|uniref:BTB domain-containing protein n=1 Tax=Lophiotrema nucula TaxID=690887 RepID=A0A6A5YXV1_9PLEO|nr:hypothetical protein BDV96DRAFT_649643 [Lophiotrema nucula]
MASKIDSERDTTLSLLHGPSIEVKVISESGFERKWSLSKALLLTHSGYFRRACRDDTFQEGINNQVELKDFEPEVFLLFIEFMLYGRYSSKDDLQDFLKIRDSAMAWVLGDYLDATEFKNCAMRDLYAIYCPGEGLAPKSGIGPAAIYFVCSKTMSSSHLWHFFKDVTVAYWHDEKVVAYYSQAEREDWSAVWDIHREFRDDLMYLLNQTQSEREEQISSLEYYIDLEHTVSLIFSPHNVTPLSQASFD